MSEAGRHHSSVASPRLGTRDGPFSIPAPRERQLPPCLAVRRICVLTGTERKTPPGDSTTSVPEHLCPIHATEFTRPNSRDRIHATEFTQPNQTTHAATETDAPTSKRRTTATRTTSKQLGSEHEQANSTKDRETAREAAVRLSADGLPKISQRSAAPRRRAGRNAGGSLADQKAASGRKSLNVRILVARGPPFNPNPTSARADLVADRGRPVAECRESTFLPRLVSPPDISEEPFPTWGGFATVGVSWPGPPEILAASNS
jgi:hypothetical protein